MSAAAARIATPMTERRRSRHLLANGWSAVPERLDDGALVRRAILSAIESIGVTEVSYSEHRFSSCGISAVALLADSHPEVHAWPERTCFAAELADFYLVVHTWPERAYFGADLFFCGPADAEVAMRALAKSLGAADLQLRFAEYSGARRAGPKRAAALPSQANALA